VHALPSLHDVPFGLTGFEQRPVLGEQVPAKWHWSEGAQVTAVPGLHVPDWQVSPMVQALLSLHDVPLGKPLQPFPATGTKRRLSM
jgi:hypothetical protein